MDFHINTLLAEFSKRYNEKYLPRLRALRPLRNLAVWGTGSIGHQFAIDSGWGAKDVIYVDPNPVNQGKFLSVTEHEIFAPGAINKHGCDTILIASGWEDDVRDQIAKFVKKKVDIISFFDLIR